VTITCSAYQPNSAAPVSSTNKAVKSEKIYLPTGNGAVDCSTPRALATDEVAEYVEHFRKAAHNCIEAGMSHLWCVSVRLSFGFLVNTTFF
jgi:2,4-dienoyl-CoA reductase-like NADH-dependent reductase (Old Yellow Enzyme family)